MFSRNRVSLATALLAGFAGAAGMGGAAVEIPNAETHRPGPPSARGSIWDYKPTFNGGRNRHPSERRRNRAARCKKSCAKAARLSRRRARN